MDIADDFWPGKGVAWMHHQDSYRVCHALEDLPADAWAQLRDIASLPLGLSLRRKVFDELENAGLDAYGDFERVRLLRFLSDYRCG